MEACLFFTIEAIAGPVDGRFLQEGIVRDRKIVPGSEVGDETRFRGGREDAGDALETAIEIPERRDDRGNRIHRAGEVDFAIQPVQILGVVAGFDVRGSVFVQRIVMEIDGVGSRGEILFAIGDVEHHVVILVIRCRMLLEG